MSIRSMSGSNPEAASATLGRSRDVARSGYWQRLAERLASHCRVIRDDGV